MWSLMASRLLVVLIFKYNADDVFADCLGDGSEFTCFDLSCIPFEKVCDGNRDCPRRSDEGSCLPKLHVCKKSEYACPEKCIPASFQCDCNNDCSDGSDEEGCNIQCVSRCSSGQFQCNNDKCIPTRLKCDHVDDCGDKSDEVDCAPHTCSSGQFQCSNGRCIPVGWKCDRQDDCGDSSDEVGCISPKCGANEFQCGNGSCIPKQLNCNGNSECFDENVSLCPCNVADGKPCEQTTLCDKHPCSQLCEDVQDGFKCACVDGYQLASDNRSCVADRDVDPKLLVFAAGATIIEYPILDDGIYSHTPSKSKRAEYNHREIYNRYADYNLRKNELFYSSVSSIYRLSLDLNNNSNTEVVTNTSSCGDIAVDWIHNNLYYTSVREIKVVDLDSLKEVTLVYVGVSIPRAIVVHPGIGYVFWTVYGDSIYGSIEKAGMDGSKRQTIAGSYIHSDALTIDYAASTLYWVDNNLKILQVSDFNGNNLQTIYSSRAMILDPYAITLFEDVLYWSDTGTEDIVTANKLNPKSTVARHTQGSLAHARGLTIVHPLRQPEFENLCGKCPENSICLPTPVNTSSSPFVCRCPDGKNCEDTVFVSCEVNNGGCADKCVDSTCQCSFGFKLGDDGKSCDQIMSCGELIDSCSHWCDDSTGEVKCKCSDGYRLTNDGRSCVAKSIVKAALMIVEQETSIVSYRIVDEDNFRRKKERTFDGNIVSIDYDFERKYLYWSDATLEMIFRAPLNLASKSKPEVVVRNVSDSGEGIAVDWVHNNLYFTETKGQAINAVNLDTLKLVKVVSEDLDKPRAIAVHPGIGHIFWTDWGTGTVEKAGMDGSHRQVIANDLIWPNGLTIDFPTFTLYWFDANLDILQSSDIFGRNVVTILASSPFISHPLGLAIFEDQLYWTEWKYKALVTANKRDPETSATVHQRQTITRGITIVHPLRQPKFDNLCGNCSENEVCLPRPVGLFSTAFICKCADGETCEEPTKRLYPIIVN